LEESFVVVLDLYHRKQSVRSAQFSEKSSTWRWSSSGVFLIVDSGDYQVIKSSSKEWRSVKLLIFLTSFC